VCLHLDFVIVSIATRPFRDHLYSRELHLVVLTLCLIVRPFHTLSVRLLPPRLVRDIARTLPSPPISQSPIATRSRSSPSTCPSLLHNCQRAVFHLFSKLLLLTKCRFPRPLTPRQSTLHTFFPLLSPSHTPRQGQDEHNDHIGYYGTSTRGPHHRGLPRKYA
jgi:hypothetical protein